MREEHETVYRSPTVADVQHLADRLREAGIEAFVDDTESPLYGAPVGPRGRLVRVRVPVAARAREIVRRFEGDGHPGIPAEEWHREETGLEVASSQRPSDDSPVAGIEPNTERPHVEDALPEAPESLDLSGPDRRPADGESATRHPAEVEQPEVEERPIEQLDLETDLAEEPREAPRRSPRREESRTPPRPRPEPPAGRAGAR